MKEIIAFTIASIAVALIPGPDTMVVLRATVSGGRRDGLATIAGVLTGLFAWITLTTAGIAVLFAASKVGYLILHIVGGLYLLYLGVTAIFSKSSPLNIKKDERPRSVIAAFSKGMATDLLNPKVGIFFISFLPSFIPKGANVPLATLAYGVDFLIVSLAYLVVVVVGSQALINLLADRRKRRGVEVTTGAILSAFGVKILLG
ncbi:MAG: LysE family translocator [Actinomycetota bacterium]|jgi:threonine/homoserine/homoserine lactone efflux protein|nr:LysE family translocator [Actinomycetota bacterium]